MLTLSFFVNGVPIPQGSVSKRGRNVVAVTPELKAWRDNVRSAAMAADPDMAELYFPLDRPLFIRCRFYLPKPKRPRWEYPAVKPDGDKLLRAIQDALTDTPERTTRGKRPRTIPAQPGVVVDDSRFVSGTYDKYYSDAPGASITIGEILI